MNLGGLCTGRTGVVRLVSLSRGDSCCVILKDLVHSVAYVMAYYLPGVLIEDTQFSSSTV